MADLTHGPVTAPPAPADGLEVQPVSNPYELEVVAWHRVADKKPEPGTKFVALYDDGSGAWIGFAHDGGFIDSDGDDHNNMPGAEWWAYLPSGFRLWCEDTAEDAFTLPEHALHSPPRDARIAEQQAEIERLRGLLVELLLAIDNGVVASAAVGDPEYQWLEPWIAKVRTTLAKIGEPR